MNPEQIVRSWKDEAYRMSLSDAELALMPSDPAGLVELTDEQLANIDGGSTVAIVATSSIICSVVSIVSVIGSAYASCVLC